MPTPYCKHSNFEVFFDEGKGYWGQCKVCGAVSEHTRTSNEARALLKSMKMRRPHNQGGARPGAGRRRTLSKRAKFRAFTLEPHHDKVLDQFQKKYNKIYDHPIRGRSAALRTILEGIDLDDLVQSYGS